MKRLVKLFEAHFIFVAKTSAIKPNDDSAFPTRSHDHRTNPIREPESRREGKGQGSISDLNPSGDLKFRIPSEPEALSIRWHQNPFAPNKIGTRKWWKEIPARVNFNSNYV